MASEIVDQHQEPWSRLDGKVVVVTGASSGIGLEFCLDLAKAGCRIVAMARRKDRIKSLCDQINGGDQGSTAGCRAVAVELDISAGGAVIEAGMVKAWDAFGHIDALINNAGVRGQTRSSLDITEEEWNQVVKTNLNGTWLVSKFVASRWKASGRRGSIINISSINGLNRVQFYGGIAYNASKSAMNSITKTMALELGPYNIRVNAIAPSIFPSEVTASLFRRKDLGDTIKKLTPMGALGVTDPELTSIIRYLIHDSSNYVSGNIFIVDGGTTLLGIPIYSSL